MLVEEIRDIKSTKKKLKNFAVTIFVALILIGIFLLIRKKEYYFYFFIVSITFLISGFIAPFVLKPIYRVWMSIALIMGWVMMRVILSVLFCLVVTPIGLLRRILRKNSMDLKFDKNAESYWVKSDSFSGKDYYKKQY